MDLSCPVCLHEDKDGPWFQCEACNKVYEGMDFAGTLQSFLLGYGHRYGPDSENYKYNCRCDSTSPITGGGKGDISGYCLCQVQNANWLFYEDKDKLLHMGTTCLDLFAPAAKNVPDNKKSIPTRVPAVAGKRKLNWREADEKWPKFVTVPRGLPVSNEQMAATLVPRLGTDIVSIILSGRKPMEELSIREEIRAFFGTKNGEPGGMKEQDHQKKKEVSWDKVDQRPQIRDRAFINLRATIPRASSRGAPPLYPQLLSIAPYFTDGSGHYVSAVEDYVKSTLTEEIQNYFDTNVIGNTPYGSDEDILGGE